MSTSSSTMCLRLPPDMYTAVVEMAESQGVTVSEWARDQLYRIIYGQPLGIEQGYREGRQLGFRSMQLAFKRAWDQTPETVEDAVTEIQAYSQRPR